MKTGQSIKCFFWAILYCVLYLVSASEEDLSDFDFSDLKEIDWNYDNDNANSSPPTTASEKKVQNNVVTFDDYDEVENQVRPFDWRENVLRTALSKALTNAALRQKFVEVMPILRVLSSQQRLALSALISAQINTKQGQELKLEQVRMMFGDDKKLLLPIVYDIANLVRSSARKYLNFEFDTVPASKLQQLPIAKRKFDLTPAEVEADDTVGTIQMPVVAAASDDDSMIEDFFDEMAEDVLDPQSINEELQASMLKSTTTKSNINKTTTTRAHVTAPLPTEPSSKRLKRAAAAASTQFVHKLLRSLPLSVNEEDLLKGAAGRTVKLNTTAFLQPKEQNLLAATDSFHTTTATTANTPTSIISTATASTKDEQTFVLPYEEVENIAFASLDGAEINLNVSATDRTANDQENIEPLPSPEELISGPRYRVSGGNKLHLMRPKVATKRKRTQMRPRSKTPSHTAAVSASKKCERFTASMCIRTDDYPLEQIMGSIRRHKNAMTALLAEYYDKTNHLDSFDEEFDDFTYNNKRREDDTKGGGMCQSIVRYARPQKARSASGEWKYIVNTGQHTQTLRLEKCSNPQEGCSYLAHTYRSHCSQVYNYHRLLSWDKMRGLHVDIFKVPTCCSCQVDGYRQQFPPIAAINSKDFSPADAYSTINDDLNYNDDDDEEDLSYQFSNGFGGHPKHDESLDENELFLGSKKVRSKVYPPQPTIGAYLSPPGSSDEFETVDYPPNFQRGISSTSSSHGYHGSRRRPYKSLNNAVNEPRVDLEIAPSEPRTDKEVNIFGTLPHALDKARVHQQKRKRIYSVPHTATSTTPTRATGVLPSSSSSSGTTTRSTNSFASNAHQAPATSASYYTSSGVPGNTYNSQGQGISSGKPKSRFRATSSTALATSPSTTESTTYYYKTPATLSPPIYHVNSIYSSNYNPNNTAKRINYNYHPIIDFFESNRRSSGVVSTSTLPATVSTVTSKPTAHPHSSVYTASSERLYPYKIPKSNSLGSNRYQSHERRIGYGAAANAAAASDGDGGVSNFSEGVRDDNVWHPVIVKS